MTNFRQILKQYWGFSDFRPLQDEIIESVAKGKDTLGLMPTGGGKSLTFQVPTMAMEGICLVVTPLIALMKDQVENLKKRDIKATMVYSGMSQNEIITTLENCIFGNYKFLYISPERLGTELFLQRLPRMNVCLLAVDESHCISQWGYDFRPSYLKIADIRKIIPDTPVLALTATATPEVVGDIQEKLLFKEKNVFRKSFERKNLSYLVRKVEDKPRYLLKILENLPGTSVVYVRNRKKTREISDFLNGNGIRADYFHAGLTDTDKNRKQKAWKSGDCRVIVATNAFGMGIDKSDVRSVVHIDLPDTVEAYFQEAGRAGRDEQQAFAVLLYSNADAAKLRKRIADNFPEREFITRIYEALGNYYQIAVGYGTETVRDFDIAEFCRIFHFPILPTHSALKILQQAGYLELTDEAEHSSRLMFTMQRDKLYHFRSPDKQTDELIQLILRSYTGLFSDYVFINDDTLANRLGTTPKDIYQKLTNLSQWNVLKYIPRRKTPVIIYTHDRVEAQHLQISKEIYEQRKERFINR
ncbi:MAG: ATP-dependent DNA helicase, partial [Prevotellaceae bacterium]|nr:ATP-dependent DNA helicase [Prevotellaceae bacterium]